MFFLNFQATIVHCLLQTVMFNANLSTENSVSKYIFMFNNLYYMRDTINAYFFVIFLKSYETQFPNIFLQKFDSRRPSKY